MPIKLAAPLEKVYPLIKSDEEFGNEGEPTTVTIKQASQGAFDYRDDLMERFKREYAVDGTIRVSQDISFAAIKRTEVLLTMKDSNLLGPDGELLFNFKDGKISEADFIKGWSQLHPFIANEIHEYVLEMNPLWTSLGEAG